MTENGVESASSIPTLAGSRRAWLSAADPNLGSGPLVERLERFRQFHDDFRSAVVNEPRGSDVMVGALLCDPVDPDCLAGVIFFNNVGYLGMCGHGTIGVATTLAYMGRMGVGSCNIQTPVGIVRVCREEGGEITVSNVASYRTAPTSR